MLLAHVNKISYNKMFKETFYSIEYTEVNYFVTHEENVYPINVFSRLNQLPAYCTFTLVFGLIVMTAVP